MQQKKDPTQWLKIDGYLTAFHVVQHLLTDVSWLLWNLVIYAIK